MHAHEEDKESELVYRPASYSLPPSRGRSALNLVADGTYVESSPGPTDRPEQAAGTWVLEDDRLTLRDRCAYPDRGSLLSAVTAIG